MHVPRSRMALALVAALFGVTGVAAAAVMPTPAYADAIRNAYDLNGYKIMSSIDPIYQARYSEPADYQAARWTGTRWESQAAYAHDQKAAYVKSLSGYQATPAVASTSHATQMATQTVNGKTRAGAGTVLKTAEIDEAAKSARIPAFKGSTIAKVGSAGTAMIGLQAGWDIGRFGMDLFGVDVNGLVCSSGNKGWEALYSADCGKDQKFLPDFEVNGDAKGGLTMKACDDGGCVTYTGVGKFQPTWQGNPIGDPFYSACFSDTTALTKAVQSKVGNGWVLVIQQSSGGMGIYSIQGPGMEEEGADCFGVGGGWATRNLADSPTKMQTVLGTFQCVRPQYRPDGSNIVYNGDQCAGGSKFEDAPADPVRVVTCEVTGSDGKVYSQAGQTYRESDGVLPTPECPALPEGVTPSHLELQSGTSDGKIVNKLQSQDATPAYKEATAQYPECSTGLCTLDLVQTSSDKSCFDLDETCKGWFQDPDKATKYGCYYGSHKLDLSKCNTYAQVFDPAKRAAGNPYAMPDGSDPEIQSTKTDSQKAFDDPVQDPTDIRTCISTGMSLNPITWVQFPVQCALQWAFVPRPLKLRESAATVTTSWDKTAPVELSQAVGGWSFKPVMTGCNGIPYPKDLIYKGMDGGRLGNACPGTPLAPAASFTSIILTILASVGAAFAVASYMGWTIGFRGPAES